MEQVGCEGRTRRRRPHAGSASHRHRRLGSGFSAGRRLARAQKLQADFLEAPCARDARVLEGGELQVTPVKGIVRLRNEHGLSLLGSGAVRQGSLEATRVLEQAPDIAAFVAQGDAVSVAGGASTHELRAPSTPPGFVGVVRAHPSLPSVALRAHMLLSVATSSARWPRSPATATKRDVAPTGAADAKEEADAPIRSVGDDESGDTRARQSAERQATWNSVAATEAHRARESSRAAHPRSATTTAAADSSGAGCIASRGGSSAWTFAESPADSASAGRRVAWYTQPPASHARPSQRPLAASRRPSWCGCAAADAGASARTTYAPPLPRASSNDCP